MELDVPGAGAEGEREPSPGPQVGTLDLDLMINRLLSYKDNPGKQVRAVDIHDKAHVHTVYEY